MDQETVRAVLRSSGKFMANLADKKDLDKLIEKLPVLEQSTSSALSISLTDLITYKVTPDAYQRYSVRIKIIEMLREWIRPPIGLTSYHPFYQTDNLLQLCQGMMKKYFMAGNFDDTISGDDFIVFGRELINIAERNSLYVPHVKSFFEKISNFDLPFNIHVLVESVLDHEEQFQLEFPLVENLYIINCMKLIEEPLIDGFLANLTSKNIESYTATNIFDKLMRCTAKSPKIFQIICSILKALFVRLKYSTSVLDYVQFVIKHIKLNRPDDKKCILNLYPSNLQACVIVLQINPCHHTTNSRKFVLQTLKTIYLENTHQVLTLLTHFPNWLDPLLSYIPELIYDENKL